MGELHKNKECIHCEKLFDCKGKPRKVDLCLHFTERKQEDGRSQMDKDVHKHF